MEKTALETLYDSIEGFEKLGVNLPRETQAKLDELEEQLITSEVLPALTKDIEPRLSKIRRKLVLVVEYNPGEPISVALSRKTNIIELIKAKHLEIDPQVEHKIGKSRPNSHPKAPKTGLRICRRDGSILQEDKAADTFVKAIVEADVYRVRGLNLKFCKVNLVSTSLDEKYTQKEVKKGVYILTHSSTENKKRMLEKINEKLGMGWKIEIV